jgi:amidase
MMLETDSNIYGPTLNPHNTTLTPGGSSGGEGALLALRGSCLSISTDIGTTPSHLLYSNITELRS